MHHQLRLFFSQNYPCGMFLSSKEAAFQVDTPLQLLSPHAKRASMGVVSVPSTVYLASGRTLYGLRMPLGSIMCLT